LLCGFSFCCILCFFVPGDTELLEHLLSKGINPDLESDAGTPLVWAAGHAQEAAVTVLLKHGANVIPHSILLFCVTFL
jgi:ankyrin repeat protein